MSFLRNKKAIKNSITGQCVEFKSINRAKKHSRGLQEGAWNTSQELKITNAPLMDTSNRHYGFLWARASD